MKNSSIKFKLFICIAAIILCKYSAFSQIGGAVTTPKGSIVSDTYPLEESLTASDINYIKNRTGIEYPYATIIGEPTSTYNCHAYAWHMTEGGDPVWMGISSNPTSIYWADGSYIETYNQFPSAKVSYANDNHSAITTGNYDIFESKWGALALMRHPKAHCPYNSSGLRYFKKSVAPPVVPAPVHGNVLTLNGRRAEYKYGNQYSVGENFSINETLKFIYTDPNTGETSDFNGNYNIEVLPSSEYDSWRISSFDNEYEFSFHKPDVTILLKISIKSQGDICEYYNVNVKSNEYSHYSVYPNPAISSSIQLELKDVLKTQEVSLDNEDIHFEIFNINTASKNLKGSMKKGNSTIDVSSLSNGLYILKITKGKHTESHRIVIKK